MSGAWHGDDARFYLRLKEVYGMSDGQTENRVLEESTGSLGRRPLRVELGRRYRVRAGGGAIVLINVVRADRYGGTVFYSSDSAYHRFPPERGWYEDGRDVLGSTSADLVEEIADDGPVAPPTPPPTAKEKYLAFHEAFTRRMTEITKRKNADYTGSDPDPFANFRVCEKLGICSVETGFLVRMCDKFIRIANLADGREAQVKDEAVDDTLLDLANYAALFAAYLTTKRKGA